MDETSQASSMTVSAADFFDGVSVLLQTGDYAAAAELLNHRLSEYPEDAVAWYGLALIMAQTGNPHVAQELFESAIHFDANNADYHQALGELQLKMAQFDLARNSFSNALTLNPNSVASINALLRIREAQSQHVEGLPKAVAERKVWRLPEAVRALQSLREVSPYSVPVVWHLAACFVEQGQYIQAAEAYAAVVDAGTRTPQLLREYAEVLRRLREHDDAASLLDEAQNASEDGGEGGGADALLMGELAALLPSTPRPLLQGVSESARALDFFKATGFERKPLEVCMCTLVGAAPTAIVSREHLDNLVASADAELAPFLKGLAASMEQDWYHLAEAFFAWLACPSDQWQIKLFQNYSGNYGLEIYPRGADEAPTERLGLLIELMAYVSDSSLLEGSAVAISKHLGTQGNFLLAKAIVENALMLSPRSQSMQTTMHVIKSKIEGIPIPSHWEKFVGADSGVLAKKICSLPFEFFDITETGDVLMCCGHWLPTVVGSFYDSSVVEIFNSKNAIDIRKSVVDGSYRFCNHIYCNVMANNNLQDKTDVKPAQEAMYAAIHKDEYFVESPTNILYGIDRTCNLSCPSCRTDVIIERGDVRLKIVESTRRSVIPLLSKAKKLYLNPGGEVFFSKPSRELLGALNKERFPDLAVDIISNGILFTEKEWAKFPGVHSMMNMVRISIDGANKETFERLRRGGTWERLQENLQFLSGLRKRGEIKKLYISFTYQIENFREMPAFADMAEALGCDCALFERVMDLVYGNESFSALAVHLPEHPLFEEFLEVLNHPSMRKPVVFGDFDFGVRHTAS